LIVPIVVYHGERAWDAAQAFGELVDVPGPLGNAVAHLVPSFQFVLDDLTARTDEEIRARQAPPFAAVSWILFRHSYDPERGIDVWRQCADLVRDLLAQVPEWQGSLEQLVRYSLIRGLGTPAELREELRQLGEEAEEVAVTAGEKLLDQGRSEGLLEGERRILLRLLRKRFSPIPETVEARLKSATETQLEEWSDRVLAAETLDEVFE